jgi:hypothetical protein
MADRNKDDQGRFAGDRWLNAARGRPLTSAAAAAGVAAAGAFLWSRRDQIGSALSSGMDRYSEYKSQRMGSNAGQSPQRTEESGRKTKGPRGPIAQQDIKAGTVAY